jgi:hypothetical protein
MLRRNPSRVIAASTRSAVSACTPGSSLTTRDTVLMLTPARRATSLIVARRTRRPDGLDNVVMVRRFDYAACPVVNVLTYRRILRKVV